MDTFSGAGVHDVSTAIVLPSLRFSSVPRISRRHEDMSTTSDPRNTTAYGAGDQEKRHCADLRIVPTSHRIYRQRSTFGTREVGTI